MIVIVDYDTGNTRSLSKAFEKIGLATVISADPALILAAGGVVLPGVGAFPKAMKSLTERGLVAPILAAVEKGTPLLGICLGMQLLFERSFEYGETKGLGLIPGQVLPFPQITDLRIPHMGWNELQISQKQTMTKAMAHQYVYYVHSYYVDCAPEFVLATSEYGVSVPGIVRQGHVYGMQFHPEKSGVVGQELLRAFKKVVEA